MKLDVCRNCQIQAPHREGRGACPRCNGPLVVVDDQTQAQAAASAGRSTVLQSQAQPQQRPVSQQPPISQQQRVHAPVAPRPRTAQPPSRPRLRWVAHRPAATLPARRRPPSAPRGTPFYRGTPRWGLFDVVSPEPEQTESTFDVEQTRLTKTFRMAGALLAGAAATEAIRYGVVLLNRSRPIPEWADQLTAIAVLVFGVMAVAASVMALYVFAGWVVASRARAYGDIGRTEPRKRWLMTVLIMVPFVSVVAAPWLMLEAAAVAASAPDADPAAVQRRRRWTNRVAVAWGLVNLLGAIALGYRIVGFSSDSLQTAADGLVWVTLTVAASSLFLYWASHRVPQIVDDEDPAAPAPRRMVAV